MKKAFKQFFLKFVLLCGYFVSISVSVSSGERSFSKLGIVKNCRRSTMGQERLSSLIMLSCEHDIARKINYDDVIESFPFKCAPKASLYVDTV